MCERTVDPEELRPITPAAARAAAVPAPSPASRTVRWRPSSRSLLDANAEVRPDGALGSGDAGGDGKGDDLDVGVGFVVKVVAMLCVLFVAGVQLGNRVPRWIENARAPASTLVEDGASELSEQEEMSSEEKLLQFLSTPSPAKDEVFSLIVHEYIDPTGGEWLGSTVAALQMLNTDGEPVQVEGRPYLFVGSIGASINHESLLAHNITYIVNWSPTAKCNAIDGVEYLCFRDIESKSGMLRHVDKLHQAVQFIDKARKAGGRALSHCWFGRNRSVTLLVAYLMKDEGMTIPQALKLIKKTRPQADPYIDALKEYKRRYL